MRRPVLLALLLALVAGACSSPEESSDPTVLETFPPPTSVPLPVDPFSDRQALVGLPGQLAITAGPELWVVSPDGTTGTVLDGGGDVFASQPVWSRDGAQLAWSSADADRQSIVVRDNASDARVTSDANGGAAFYLQWNVDGEQLAYLRPSQDEAGGIEAGTVSPGSAIEPIGSGSPFFFSWAPESDEIVAHIAAGRVVRFGEPVGADDESLLSPTGQFQAPVWLDSATVLAGAESSIVRIDVTTGESDIVIDASGEMRFVLSPDGSRLAYVAAEAADSTTGPPLRVLDLTTGQTDVVSEGFALAWEWSPDGERLAYLGPAVRGSIETVNLGSGSSRALQQGQGVRWSFWDGELIDSTPAYRPSRRVLTSYLPFFEQYAQSHHRWSPDGAAFAFAGGIEGQRGIWVQLVGDDAEIDAPVLVASGDSVTWSPAASASGGSSIV